MAEYISNEVFKVVVVVLLVLLFIVMIVDASVSGFSNERFEDAANTSMRDVLFTHTGADEKSLQSKVDAAAAKAVKSQLTGFRDAPVFFQDYDYDMQRKKNGAVTNTREGFESGAIPSDKLLDALRSG